MTESKTKEVEELLGAFVLVDNSDYALEVLGVNSDEKNERTMIIAELLCDNRIRNHILDNVERCYLEKFLRPFRDLVVYIQKLEKSNPAWDYDIEWIKIEMSDNNMAINLPYFKKGKMYQGMETNKAYTLDELELFDNSIYEAI